MDSENNSPETVVIDGHFKEAEEDSSTPTDTTEPINDLPQPETPQEETFPELRKVERDNITLYNADGTVKTFNSDTSASGATHLASAETVIVEDEDRKPAEREERTKRVTDPKYKDTVDGHQATAKIAKPYLKNTGPDERSKDRSKLDDADLRGIRQNDQARSHHVAELHTVNSAVKKYEEELVKGRVLGEEELNLLRDTHLRAYHQYEDQENYYKKLGLPEEDKKLLLDKHFEKEILEFETSLKDDAGNYNSSKCSVRQWSLLIDTEKAKISQLHYQDRRARQEENEDQNRREREKEYKKQFEETHGIPWSVEAEKLLQDKNLLTRERDLYKEESDKKKVEEPEKIEQTEEDEEEKKIVDRAKKRDIKKIAFWVGAGAGLAVGILATGSVVAVAAGVSAVGGLGAAIYGKVSDSKLKKLRGDLSTTVDEKRRAEIEEHMKRIRKQIEIAQNVKSFFSGSGLGLMVGGLINGLTMQGRGLIDTLRTPNEGLQAPPTSELPDPLVHREVTSDGTTTPPTGSINEPIAPIENLSTDGVLVRNGNIDLPGSAWNGNAAGPATGNLPGGELYSANFTGGATNMGAWNLENDLISAGLNRATLTSNLPTPQIHSLLNIYQANPGTDLLSALNRLGTEQAGKIIQILTGN